MPLQQSRILVGVAGEQHQLVVTHCGVIQVEFQDMHTHKWVVESLEVLIIPASHDFPIDMLIGVNDMKMKGFVIDFPNMKINAKFHDGKRDIDIKMITLIKRGSKII